MYSNVTQVKGDRWQVCLVLFSFPSGRTFIHWMTNIEKRKCYSYHCSKQFTDKIIDIFVLFFLLYLRRNINKKKNTLNPKKKLRSKGNQYGRTISDKHSTYVRLWSVIWEYSHKRFVTWQIYRACISLSIIHRQKTEIRSRWSNNNNIRLFIFFGSRPTITFSIWSFSHFKQNS